MIEVRTHTKSKTIDEIFTKSLPVHIEDLDGTFWIGVGHGENLRSFLITVENDELVCREQE